MLEHHDLLHQVRMAPDDDEPRLVYARWLEENGDAPRGELIALQCRIARAAGDYVPPPAAMVARESILRPAIEGRLLDCVRPFVQGAWLERGFPERVWLDPVSLGLRLELALTVSPVRHVHLTAAPGPWADELAGASLEHVWTLDLGDAAITEDAIARCVDDGSAVLAIRALGLGRAPLDPPTLRRIAAAPFARLESLSLHAGPDADHVLAAPFAARMKRLALGGDGDAAAMSVTKLPVAARLAELALDGPVGDAGVVALARSPALAALRSLRLPAVRLGDEGVRALAEAPFLDSLLELAIPEASPTDVTPLLASTRLGALRHLDVSGRRLGPEAVLALLEPSRFAALARLSLRGCGLDSNQEKSLRRRFGRGVCVFGAS